MEGVCMETKSGPLEGLVVVELGDYVAMPASSRVLGEMGATVYKIETLKGNLHRGDGPGFGMPELGYDNPAFDMSNANKKFLSIDMKTDEGRELVESFQIKLTFSLLTFATQAWHVWGMTMKRFMLNTQSSYTHRCAATGSVDL